MCEQGGECKYDFKAPIAKVQKLWEKIVFSVLSGEFKECDKLCGVRLLDKSQKDKESFFRIEVWTKFATETEESAIAIKKYIQEELIEGTLKKDACEWIHVNSAKFVTHKAQPK